MSEISNPVIYQLKVVLLGISPERYYLILARINEIHPQTAPSHSTLIMNEVYELFGTELIGLSSLMTKL